MAYATVANVTVWLEQDHLVRLTDDTRSGSYSEAVLSAVLADCAARIDADLARAGYSVPVTTPQASLDYLASLEARLALEPLFRRRPQMAMPDSVKEAWQSARDELKEIKEGSRLLPGLTKSVDTNTISVETDDDRGWSSI